jgi:methylaspartate mutase epsilon subunit
MSMTNNRPGDISPGPDNANEPVPQLTAFGDFVAATASRGVLVVQPRMGFSDPVKMREGLRAVRDAQAVTVGTITVDSYTRLGQEAAAASASMDGLPLNGYPLTICDQQAMNKMLEGIHEPGFPIQIRHGSAQPGRIVASMISAGLDATEGGPVSYCLPYGRYPLRQSMENWKAACDMLAAAESSEYRPHMETFGGCLLGQLCPPGLLVAMSVLEGLFFVQRGLSSISLSYTQQTNSTQDELALCALRRLAAELIPADVKWHVVLYTYMGLYPRSRSAALRLLADSARLATQSGVSRLIVKTAAEAHRIPSISENVEALEVAAASARTWPGRTSVIRSDDVLYVEARTLVESVLDLDGDIGEGLVQSFRLGRLDVPYCLHPDNAGLARGYVDASGWLRWARVGNMPIDCAEDADQAVQLTATGLLGGLSYIRDRYDTGSQDGADDPAAELKSAFYQLS